MTRDVEEPEIVKYHLMCSIKNVDCVDLDLCNAILRTDSKSVLRNCIKLSQRQAKHISSSTSEKSSLVPILENELKGV